LTRHENDRGSQFPRFAKLATLKFLFLGGHSRRAKFAIAQDLFFAVGGSSGFDLSFRTGIPQSTLSSRPVCPRTWESCGTSSCFSVGVLLGRAGCDKHPLTDIVLLIRQGCGPERGTVKKLNTSENEVAQLVKLKQVGTTDDGA